MDNIKKIKEEVERCGGLLTKLYTLQGAPLILATCMLSVKLKKAGDLCQDYLNNASSEKDSGVDYVKNSAIPELKKIQEAALNYMNDNPSKFTLKDPPEDF